MHSVNLIKDAFVVKHIISGQSNRIVRTTKLYNKREFREAQPGNIYTVSNDMSSVARI